MPQSRSVSDTGGLEAWPAHQLVSGLTESLRRHSVPPAPPQPLNDGEWVALEETIQERAARVIRELLGSLLPRAFDAWAQGMRDAPRAKRTRAVLRGSAPFVALAEGDREFSRLLKRAVRRCWRRLPPRSVRNRR